MMHFVLLDKRGEHEYRYVLIVRKGQAATTARLAIIKIRDADGVTAVWKRPHLLEIDYKGEEIEDFDNL